MAAFVLNEMDRRKGRRADRPAGPKRRRAIAPPPGVAAVERALAVLEAFRQTPGPLTLAELAAHTRISKSTVLRLAQSLVNGRILLRLEDGGYRLGSETLRLGALYQQGHNVADVLMPRMRELARDTGESVVFHVREGKSRVCLLRVESDQPIRYHVREGDVMPLERGCCGRVILAFSGESGEPYDGVRRDYFYLSLGERSADTSGVAVPIFGLGQELIGALGVSGPITRLTERVAMEAVPQLLSAARSATRDLGGNEGAFDGPLATARGRGDAPRLTGTRSAAT